MEITNKNIDHGKAFDWGKTSEEYAKYRDIYPKEFYAKLAELSLGVKGQNVLDLGTGTGVIPRNMYSYGAKWTGTDISENQIMYAEKLSKSAGMDIDYIVASAEAVDYPDRTFDGTVSIVYPTIDPASRTFTVEVKIPNSDESLRPGMYGTIDFFIGNTETMVVPAIAVLKLQGSNDRYVFLNKDGKAKRVAVKLGRRFEDQVELISDEIREGDELIVVGQGRLVDGSPLSITK